MKIAICEKCMRLDLWMGDNQTCPACNTKLTELGIDSTDWNKLSEIEMKEYIRNALIKNIDLRGICNEEITNKPETRIERYNRELKEALALFDARNFTAFDSRIESYLSEDENDLMGQLLNHISQARYSDTRNDFAIHLMYSSIKDAIKGTYLSEGTYEDYLNLCVQVGIRFVKLLNENRYMSAADKISVCVVIGNAFQEEVESIGSKPVNKTLKDEAHGLVQKIIEAVPTEGLKTQKEVSMGFGAATVLTGVAVKVNGLNTK